MNYTKTPAGVYFLLFISLASISWCIYRDIRLTEQFPGDLRNRVVGARMQQDGKSPYFYHWKPEDGERYYDWSNRSSPYLISNVTATPFFHRLITPISNFPHTIVAWIWLLCCYGMLITITILAMMLCENQTQRWSTWLIAVLFLHSYAWTRNINSGQMYLLMPFIAMLIYYTLRFTKNSFAAIVCGLLTGCLVLVRPTAILFILPLVLVGSAYSARYKVIAVCGALLILSIALLPKSERSFWHDYTKAVGEHVKQHQGVKPETGTYVFVPELEELEGWKLSDIRRAQQFPYYIDNGANGNAFVMINKLFGTKISIGLLGFLSVVTMVIITACYLKNFRLSGTHYLVPIVILGYLIYMTSDIFSPVHRFHYNAGQWAFPVLLAASLHRYPHSRLCITGIVTGLLLNSIPWSVIPMQQTIGEYLLFASLFGVMIYFKPVPRI